MRRRDLLALFAAAASSPAAQKPRRVAVIGHTGRGDWGHGIDTVWSAFPAIEVVAVADPDAAGRAKAQQRCRAARSYADYREMLRTEKPDLVSICPRHLDQRVEMLTAAAEAGAHVFQEKSFAKDLADADRMVQVVQDAGIKLQLAHQMRSSPYVKKVREIVGAGEIGDIQEVRTRGKEDTRAGGEDLMVLGSHLMDVMRMLLGDPQSVVAHVTTKGGPMQPGTPREPIGPIAGREIAAMYAFDGGVHGYFSSKDSNQTHPLRFGTWIYGSRGVIYLPNAIYPGGGETAVLRSASWLPGDGANWEPIQADEPEGFSHADRHILANALLVADLLESIDQDRKPVCSEVDGRWTIEMIVGVYQSQAKGRELRFPLEDRGHPLA
ncbi:MAG: gfo/Idh/MocA family oxidoreductase [Acidobacteria bacterium]|nr:gfo/Idh/MocA family oxidoreductase [Acidobacteriota bacterium]